MHGTKQWAATWLVGAMWIVLGLTGCCCTNPNRSPYCRPSLACAVAPRGSKCHRLRRVEPRGSARARLSAHLKPFVNRLLQQGGKLQHGPTDEHYPRFHPVPSRPVFLNPSLEVLSGGADVPPLPEGLQPEAVQPDTGGWRQGSISTLPSESATRSSPGAPAELPPRPMGGGGGREMGRKPDSSWIFRPNVAPEQQPKAEGVLRAGARRRARSAKRMPCCSAWGMGRPGRRTGFAHSRFLRDRLFLPNRQRTGKLGRLFRPGPHSSRDPQTRADLSRYRPAGRRRGFPVALHCRPAGESLPNRL